MVAVYGGARLLYLYLLCLYTDQQAFISVDSCLAKRRLFCGFEKLKPVGFCVVCAFCGNYKQRKYKYKSLSPINSNLHFYHSIYRMNQL